MNEYTEFEADVDHLNEEVLNAPSISDDPGSQARREAALSHIAKKRSRLKSSQSSIGQY